ncbi:hypothetical protein [Nocardioides sp.]|uniref:hypothetical protein n=1 Tax=Nocardioides sp. TaxID=35761 RepID=UPI0027328364|nr:hypothetical protein [Nocardioides sp.]MDP3891434.1 hypothetical protein [Nocardioides sp.]
MHDPMTAVALASARHDDLRREVAQLRRRRAAAPGASITHRFLRRVSRGPVRAQVASRS